MCSVPIILTQIFPTAQRNITPNKTHTAHHPNQLPRINPWHHSDAVSLPH